METYSKDALEKVLLTIDEEAWLELGETATKYPAIIVGGSVFMLFGLTERPATHDIDILEADKRISDILARYGMINSRAAAFLDSLPYNFEKRLKPIALETKVISYLTPSLEDLTVMKLYGWRPNDIVDITSPKTLTAIDWDLLDKLVYDADEAQASALSERAYKEMVSIYERYRREHR